MADVPALTLAESLLTAEQVSRLLGIPRSSVYEYARRGEDLLPAVRVGRHVHFQRTAVERWLAGHHGWSGQGDGERGSYQQAT